MDRDVKRALTGSVEAVVLHAWDALSRTDWVLPPWCERYAKVERTRDQELFWHIAPVSCRSTERAWAGTRAGRRRRRSAPRRRDRCARGQCAPLQPAETSLVPVMSLASLDSGSLEPQSTTGAPAIAGTAFEPVTQRLRAPIRFAHLYCRQSVTVNRRSAITDSSTGHPEGRPDKASSCVPVHKVLSDYTQTLAAPRATPSVPMIVRHSP
jgi:hypothetical protein